MTEFEMTLAVRQAFNKLTGCVGFSCLLAVSVLLGTGCSSRSLTHAPVEDRSSSLPRPVNGAVESVATIKPLPGSENAGKPGYYTVKPGDTLIRIGLDTGQNWRDIGRWNSLENRNLIEVGQVLRVTPPGNENSLVVTHPVTSGAVVSSASAPAQAARPAASAALPASSSPASASPAPASPSSASSAPASSASASSASTSATPASAGEDDLAWIWPAQGSLIAGFDEAKNKGFDISGKVGDAILASADGRVVYAGAGLRGYGNLIILKHNNTFLTAYAHNQTLLVKEDQTVKKGQKIAEMGSSDADRVKLHFEIRRQGKPVDPGKYLPAK